MSSTSDLELISYIGWGGWSSGCHFSARTFSFQIWVYTISHNIRYTCSTPLLSEFLQKTTPGATPVSSEQETKAVMNTGSWKLGNRWSEKRCPVSFSICFSCDVQMVESQFSVQHQSMNRRSTSWMCGWQICNRLWCCHVNWDRTLRSICHEMLGQFWRQKEDHGGICKVYLFLWPVNVESCTQTGFFFPSGLLPSRNQESHV